MKVGCFYSILSSFLFIDVLLLSSPIASITNAIVFIIRIVLLFVLIVWFYYINFYSYFVNFYTCFWFLVFEIPIIVTSSETRHNM